MTWLNRVMRMHECILPSPYEGGAGSVWRCDDCGKKWTICVRGERRGDHRWERLLEPKDYPPPPVGASGTPTKIPTAAVRELTEAIRLTVEYVGNGLLPPIEGWEWYDALVKYAPEVAQRFKDNPVILTTSDPQPSAPTPTSIPLEDVIAAYHGTGPEIHVTGQPGAAGAGRSGEVHISHGLIIVVPSEAAGALE